MTSPNDKPVGDGGVACEGSCERHAGEVMRVHVRSETYDWGEFDYCAAAIAEDRRRGLLVAARTQP